MGKGGLYTRIKRGFRSWFQFNNMRVPYPIFNAYFSFSYVSFVFIGRKLEKLGTITYGIGTSGNG